MLIFNYIFYIILFIGFFLPTNSTFYIPIGSVLFSIRELMFITLPLINMVCQRQGVIIKARGKSRAYIFLLIAAVLLVEFIIKTIAYDQSLFNGFKSFRLGLPLFSSLLLFYQGIRPSIHTIWRILLVAISVSVLLSLISLVMWLPIYYDLAAGEDVLLASNGRLANANASFGIIGLYLLFRNKDKWYNNGRLVRTALWLSILALVLSFNRTYLTLLAIEFAFLAWTDLSKGKLIRVIGILTLSISTATILYATVPIVEREMDRRILNIIFQETTIYESTIKNNREIIYEGIIQRVDEGYWIFGLPFDAYIFTKVNDAGNLIKMDNTDTSLINLLLRWGIFVVILFLLLYRNIMKNLPESTMILSLFLLASLNVDALVAHNSIFYLVIYILVIKSTKTIYYKGISRKKGMIATVN